MTTPAIKNHPASDIFPVMADAEFQKLKANISANGVLEPVWLCGGMVLDGRHRMMACAQLGISPPLREYTGDDPVGFVVSLNLHRRHLDTSQRAMVAAKLATLPKGANQHSPNGEPSKTQAEAAEMLNVGKRSVERARIVLDEGTHELIDAVERGEKSVTAALREAKPAKPAKSNPPETAPDLADELAEARKTIVELAEENESLCLSALPETELMAKVRALEAELRVTRQQRDAYMRENAELKRHNAALQRKLKK